LALEKKTEEMVLPKDVRDCFEKNKLDYATAAPAYMVTEDYKNKLWNSNFKIYKHALARLFRERNNWFGERGILKRFVSLYYKEGKDISIENSNYPFRVYLRDTIANNNYKKKLLEYYESKTVKPDYSEQYVIYFLHYQPEATTSPTGDIFVDQSLCIDMLLKNLPSEYKVYIKEHPHQFLAHREGHTSRMSFQYDDLLKNHRVKLISTTESSFDLIANSKAIGTVCGTVGWESIVRGKPVILFGISWYENYDKGVLRITDEASAKNMKDFIERYEYDEHALLAYLEAVGKNSKLAYYYKAKQKNKIGITEQQCVDNIVSSIVEKYNKIKHKDNSKTK
jgi:ribosomal protein S15P/S13E